MDVFKKFLIIILKIMIKGKKNVLSCIKVKNFCFVKDVV